MRKKQDLTTNRSSGLILLQAFLKKAASGMQPRLENSVTKCNYGEIENEA